MRTRRIQRLAALASVAALAFGAVACEMEPIDDLDDPGFDDPAGDF